jgi:leader peptidase (prepilin peptidase)/N-methyltransferase
MTTLLIVYLFVIGLCFGSMALVVVDRLKIGKDWVRGRSICTNCKRTLHPIDLIPLVSWLSTRGRCRYCHTSLSVAYPLVELGVGVAFALSYVSWPYDFSLATSKVLFIVWLLAVVLMSILFVYDFRWFKLPYKLIHPLIFLALVWAFLVINRDGLSLSIVLEHLGAVVVSAGIFQAIYTFSKGAWIGDGDIRLGVAIGLFAGNPFLAWFGLFMASLVGLVFSLPRIRKSSSKLQLKIPFGPALLVGLFVTVLYGQRIIDWYSSVLLLT